MYFNVYVYINIYFNVYYANINIQYIYCISYIIYKKIQYKIYNIYIKTLGNLPVLRSLPVPVKCPLTN